MKTNNVLSMEQQDFAARNHDLVYDFLKDNSLDEDCFYDVIIFSYLRAVRSYTERTDLREYAFSAIAWRAMKRAMDHYAAREALRARRVRMVSLDAVTESYDHLSAADILLAANRIIEALETTELWHEIRGELTEEQAGVLKLSVDGYTPREISARWKRPLREIEDLFACAISAARMACLV